MIVLENVDKLLRLLDKCEFLLMSGNVDLSAIGDKMHVVLVSFGFCAEASTYL